MFRLEKKHWWFLLQHLQSSVSGKKAELASLERNISRLSRASQDLEKWLQVHEARLANVGATIKPEDAIIPTDVLSRQAIEAQVCTCWTSCLVAMCGVGHKSAITLVLTMIMVE